MNSDKYDSNKKEMFFIKLLLNIFGFLIALLIYSIKFKSYFFSIYFIIFTILIFPLSSTVPTNKCILFIIKFCCCCKSNSCNFKSSHQNPLIEKKFIGFKYWIYFLTILINLFLIGLLFLSIFIDDLEYVSVDKRLGKKEKFMNIIEEDFTE